MASGTLPGEAGDLPCWERGEEKRLAMPERIAGQKGVVAGRVQGLPNWVKSSQNGTQ